MSVSSIFSNPLYAMGASRNANSGAGSSAASVFQPTSQSPAKTAGSALSILPASGAVQLSLDNIMALQSLDEPETPSLKEMSATEKFLAEARKDPMERMREQVMQALGLSDDALAQMTPEERQAAEKKIAELIQEKLREAMGAKQGAPESETAEMLQTLL